MEETPGSVFANVRLSSGEISRLEQNAHYYKLMGRPELGFKELELAHQQNPDNLQITNLLAQNYEESGEIRGSPPALPGGARQARVPSRLGQ